MNSHSAEAMARSQGARESQSWIFNLHTQTTQTRHRCSMRSSFKQVGNPENRSPASTESELFRELVSLLRLERASLRAEWARRIHEAELLAAMSSEEIFAEATAIYDNYVKALETGSVKDLQAYARDLSKRLIHCGVETHEVLGIVLLLRDVLARSLFVEGNSLGAHVAPQRHQPGFINILRDEDARAPSGLRALCMRHLRSTPECQNHCEGTRKSRLCTHKLGISLNEIQPIPAGAQFGANCTVIRRAAPAHQNTRSLMHGSYWPRSTVRAGWLVCERATSVREEIGSAPATACFNSFVMEGSQRQKREIFRKFNLTDCRNLPTRASAFLLQESHRQTQVLQSCKIMKSIPAKVRGNVTCSRLSRTSARPELRL